MRAFVTSVIVLAILAVVADVGLERVVEQRASQQATMLLDAPATVDLQGWPVSLRLLFGTLPRVDVHAANVPTESGIRVDRIDVTLSEVRVSLADLSAGRLVASAQSGMFVADLDAAAVEQLLGTLGRVSDVRLVDGAVQLRVAGTTIDVPVAAEGERLVLSPAKVPRGVPRRIAVPLPMLPLGATVEQVTVLDGILRLEGTFVPDALLTGR